MQAKMLFCANASFPRSANYFLLLVVQGNKSSLCSHIPYRSRVWFRLWMRCHQPQCERPQGWGSERERGERVCFVIAVVAFSQRFMLWVSTPSLTLAWGSTMAPLAPVHTVGWIALKGPCTSEVTLGLCAVPRVQTSKAMGLLALGWLFGVGALIPTPWQGEALCQFMPSRFCAILKDSIPDFSLGAWRWGEISLP